MSHSPMSVNDKDELALSVSMNKGVRVEPRAWAAIVLQSKTGRSPHLHSALVDTRDVGVTNDGSRADTPKIRNRSARPVRSQLTMLPKINSAKLIWFVHSENADGWVPGAGDPISERVRGPGSRIIELCPLHHLKCGLEIELCVHWVFAPIRTDDPSSQEIIVVGCDHDGLTVSIRMRRNKPNRPSHFSSNVISVRLPFGNAIEGIVPMMRIA